jgi:hypothetical protein
VPVPQPQAHQRQVRDIALLRGPDHYTVANPPDTAPQAFKRRYGISPAAHRRTAA